MVLIRGLGARIYHPFIAPLHMRIAHTVAILFQYDCAIFEPPSEPRVYARHHTILCIAISG